MNTIVDRDKELPNSQLIWRIGPREKHSFYWTGQSGTDTPDRRMLKVNEDSTE